MENQSDVSGSINEMVFVSEIRKEFERARRKGSRLTFYQAYDAICLHHGMTPPHEFKEAVGRRLALSRANSSGHKRISGYLVTAAEIQAWIADYEKSRNALVRPLLKTV